MNNLKNNKNSIKDANFIQGSWNNLDFVFLSFGNYFIADIIDDRIEYFYISNSSTVLYSQTQLDHPIPLTTIEDNKPAVYDQSLQITEEAHPVLISANKFLETGNISPLLKMDGFNHLSVGLLNLETDSSSELITSHWEANTNRYVSEPNDKELKLTFNKLLFSNFLPLFYQKIDYNKSFNLIFRNYKFNLPETLLKSREEMEVYQKSGSVSKDKKEDEYRKLNPNYLDALKDAAKVVDLMIEEENIRIKLQRAALEEGAVIHTDKKKEYSLLKQTYNNTPDVLISFPSKSSQEVFKFEKKDFDGDIAKKKIKETIIKGREKNKVTTDLLLRKSTGTVDEIEEYLSIPINGSEIIGNGLSSKDKRVHNAVATLIDNHIRLNPRESFKDDCNIPITVNQIHKAMGYKKNPSPKQKKLIIESMYKLGNHYIWLSNIEEYKAREIDIQHALDLYGKATLELYEKSYPNNAEIHTARRIINADPMVKKILPKNSGKSGKNSRPEDGFIINQLPPLYVHAKITGIITSVPVEWLELDGIGNSEQIKSLKLEIAERIRRAHYFKEAQKNSKKIYNEKNYNTLVLDELFKEAGINFNSKKTRYKYINIVEDILNAYKNQKNLIDKIEYSYKGGTIHSIKFFV